MNAALGLLAGTSLSPPDKLALASSTAAASSSDPFLLAALSGWVLDSLFKSRQSGPALLNAEWWKLWGGILDQLAAVGGRTAHQTAETRTLAVLVAFVERAGDAGLEDGTLDAFARVYGRLVGPALAVASLDNVLGALGVLLKTIRQLLVQETDLQVKQLWVQITRDFISRWTEKEEVKAGTSKKISSTVLSLLPYLGPLLTVPAVQPSLQILLKATVYHPSSLGRGIARESYHAPGGSSSAGPSTQLQGGIEDEVLVAVLAALATAATESDTARLWAALPFLFAAYHTALSTHAGALYPLPLRANFPTQSALRSATEVHELGKIRGAVGKWVERLRKAVAGATSEVERQQGALALAGTLKEVAEKDLYRPAAQVAEWKNVLAGVAVAAVKDRSIEDASLLLLATVAELDFGALDSVLPTVLSHLASISPAPLRAQMPGADAFIKALAKHHSRSLSVPSFLEAIAKAVSATPVRRNVLLDPKRWSSGEFGRLVAGLRGGKESEDAWSGIVAYLKPSGGDAVAVIEEPPKKKKRKVERQAAAPATESKNEGILVLLTHVARSLPTPLPSDTMRAFVTSSLDPALSLEPSRAFLRWSMVEALRKNGEEEPHLPEESRKEMLAAAKSGNEAAVGAVAVLAQSLNEETGAEVREEVLNAVLAVVLPLVNAEGMEDQGGQWSGWLANIAGTETALAAWMLLAGRYLPSLEALATEDQVDQLASVVFAGMLHPRSEEGSFGGMTRGALANERNFELRRLREGIQKLAVALFLARGGKTNVAKAQSLPALVEALHSTVPGAYWTTETRELLLRSVVELDLELNTAPAAQDELRVAVRKAEERLFRAGFGKMPDDLFAQLAEIVAATGSASPELSEISAGLWRQLVKAEIAALRASTTGEAERQMAEVIKALETGVEDAAKNVGGSVPPLFVLLEELRGAFGSTEKLPAPLLAQIKASLERVLPSIKAGLSLFLQDVRTNLGSPRAGLLQMLGQFWRADAWLSVSVSPVDPAFADLAKLLASNVINGIAAGQRPSIQAICAVLDLLAINRDRAVVKAKAKADGTEGKELKTPLGAVVTFLVLALRAYDTLASDAAHTEFELVFGGAIFRSTPEEFARCLESITETICVAATDLRSPFSVSSLVGIAILLLRYAPEGTGKQSSECVAGLLRLVGYRLEICDSREREQMALFLERLTREKGMLLSRQDTGKILALVSKFLDPASSSSSSADTVHPTVVRTTFFALVSTVENLVRLRKDHLLHLFPQLVAALTAIVALLRVPSSRTTVVEGSPQQQQLARSFPTWVWAAHQLAPTQRLLDAAEIKAVARLLESLGGKTAGRALKRKRPDGTEGASTSKDKDAREMLSLSGPLSKHAPFFFISYLHHACSSAAPIPLSTRELLQPGLFQLFGAMGKWEREALMKGFLGDGEQTEREALRELGKAWEREKYKG